MAEFLEQYGTEEGCESAPIASSWPQGFACPMCAGPASCSFRREGRLYWQCASCRHQRQRPVQHQREHAAQPPCAGLGGGLAGGTTWSPRAVAYVVDRGAIRRPLGAADRWLARVAQCRDRGGSRSQTARCGALIQRGAHVVGPQPGSHGALGHTAGASSYRIDAQRGAGRAPDCRLPSPAAPGRDCWNRTAAGMTLNMSIRSHLPEAARELAKSDWKPPVAT